MVIVSDKNELINEFDIALNETLQLLDLLDKDNLIESIQNDFDRFLDELRNINPTNIDILNHAFDLLIEHGRHHLELSGFSPDEIDQINENVKIKLIYILKNQINISFNALYEYATQDFERSREKLRRDINSDKIDRNYFKNIIASLGYLGGDTGLLWLTQEYSGTLSYILFFIHFVDSREL